MESFSEFKILSFEEKDLGEEGIEVKIYREGKSLPDTMIRENGAFWIPVIWENGHGYILSFNNKLRERIAKVILSERPPEEALTIMQKCHLENFYYDKFHAKSVIFPPDKHIGQVHIYCEECGSVKKIYRSRFTAGSGQSCSKTCARLLKHTYKEKKSKVCPMCDIAFQTYSDREFCCVECNIAYLVGIGKDNLANTMHDDISE